MKEKIFISCHPLALDKIGKLRDKKTRVDEFRRLMSEISIILGCDALAGLPVEKAVVQTPLGSANCMKAGKDITFIAILRAGLGMIDGLLKLAPSANVGHIGIYRNEQTLDPVRYYVRFPKNLRNQYVVLADPMLATGGSVVEAVDILKSHGASKVIFVCVLAAKQGLRRLHEKHPDVPVYTGAVDNMLNLDGYIAPGLGDAGDRMFGTD